MRHEGRAGKWKRVKLFKENWPMLRKRTFLKIHKSTMDNGHIWWAIWWVTWLCPPPPLGTCSQARKPIYWQFLFHNVKIRKMWKWKKVSKFLSHLTYYLLTKYVAEKREKRRKIAFWYGRCLIIALPTHVTNKRANQVTYDFSSTIAVLTKFKYVRDAIRTYSKDLHRKTVIPGISFPARYASRTSGMSFSLVFTDWKHIQTRNILTQRTAKDELQ